MAQYSSTGTLNWCAKIISSSASATARAYGNSQTFLGGGVAFDTTCNGMNCIVDSASNLIITVENCNLTLYNATGGGSTTTSRSDFGYVLAKYNSAGTLQWAITIKGYIGIQEKNGNNTSQYNPDPFDPGIGKSICVDSSNNIYSSGWVISAATAGQIFTSASGSGGGTVTITTTLSNAFLVKYSSTGIVQWASLITAATGMVNLNQIACDSLGNIYIIGKYGYTTAQPLTLTNATGGGTTVLSANLSTGQIQTTGFIAKYDSAGNVQWAARLGPGTNTSAVSTNATGITIDADNNIYVTGSIYSSTGGPFSFYNRSNVAYTQTLTRTSGADGFMVKYTPGGEIAWVSRGLGSGKVPFNGVVTDSSKGLYVYANTSKTTTSLTPPQLYNAA